MLFGEHAVLRGGGAIAAAIDCRLSVSLTPRADSLIELHSPLGSVSTSCDALLFGSRLRFVEAVFHRVKNHLPSGASITISSAIDPSVGLGSSASVTVALLAALKTWIEGSIDRASLLQECCTIIRAVQGHGSGADAASIIYGGVISYHATEMAVSPLAGTLPLVLVYSGKKTPTPEVIRFVNSQEQRSPKLYATLFSAINEVTDAAIPALASGDYPFAGALMNHAHGLMEALGVGTPELSSLCWLLRRAPSIYGAKISGSGLGDAVIGLGSCPDVGNGRQLPSEVSTTGVEVSTWNK